MARIIDLGCVGWHGTIIWERKFWHGSAKILHQKPLHSVSGESRIFLQGVTDLFETPLFLDICWRSRLSFHVMIGHTVTFDFVKKHFFWSRPRPRCRSSLVFRLSLVLSMVQFFAGNQLFAMKTTSHVKPDPTYLALTLKIHFWGQSKVKWFSGQEGGYLQRIWTWPCSKTRLSLKTRLDLYPALSLTKKILNFFFKKSNATVCTITTWKDSLLCQHKSEKRVCLKKDSNHETPSMFSSISQQKVNGF